MAVFGLDKQKRALMPCTEKHARSLLQDRIGGNAQLLRVKLDPDSKITAIAVVRESKTLDPRLCRYP
jgi:hypothetical protein